MKKLLKSASASENFAKFIFLESANETVETQTRDVDLSVDTNLNALLDNNDDPKNPPKSSESKNSKTNNETAENNVTLTAKQKQSIENTVKKWHEENGNYGGINKIHFNQITKDNGEYYVQAEMNKGMTVDQASELGNLKYPNDPKKALRYANSLLKDNQIEKVNVPLSKDIFSDK